MTATDPDLDRVREADARIAVELDAHPVIDDNIFRLCERLTEVEAELSLHSKVLAKMARAAYDVYGVVPADPDDT